MSFASPPHQTRFKRYYSALELSLGGALLYLIVLFVPGLLPSPAAQSVTAMIYGAITLATLVYWRQGLLGWANRVTLLRGMLLAVVAGALADDGLRDAIWLWLAVAVVSLALDGVDGFVARKTKSHSRFGARFDMELDALMILLLCIGLIRLESLGAWVLSIGVMRYAFVLAGWLFGWLSTPLFESFRRKTVCVWQVVALLLALTPLTSYAGATLLALSALVASIYSFGVDIGWLYRRARVA